MRTFKSVKQALGWAVARRCPRLSQSKPGERVQAERSSPEDGWTASAIFAALGRAGISPHGPEAEPILDWATRSDHDIGDDGQSWSTHLADIEAEAATSDARVATLRAQAAREAKLVAEAVRALEGELARVGLLIRPEPISAHRCLEVGPHGFVRAVYRSHAPSHQEQVAMASLAKLEGLMIGPQLPPRDRAGARARFEAIAHRLARGERVGGWASLAELDEAVAEFMGCKVRTAREIRLRVWGVKGRRGRPRVNARDHDHRTRLDPNKLATHTNDATDSCAL